MRPNRASNNIERYDLIRSPFAQKPTQRDMAALLGETRADLRRLANYKEQFIVRRQITTGKSEKLRDLAYPESRLRRVHERLKFHLNKIKQPDYLYSPRRQRSQRDNALLHLDQDQYLTLDLKQFYPSTTEQMVNRWFRDELGMYADVARLLTRLCTVDGRVSFGSPVTPVLCTLIHRDMFNRIAQICDSRGLRYSVWVDDLTISGRFVPGEVVDEIRDAVRAAGLQSHKITYRSGNRPVFITGIGVVGPKLVAPSALHRKLKDLWTQYHDAESDDERDAQVQRLLSQLGTARYIVGSSSSAGMKISSQMNSLKQKKDKRARIAESLRREEREAAERIDAGNYFPLPFETEAQVLVLAGVEPPEGAPT